MPTHAVLHVDDHDAVAFLLQAATDETALPVSLYRVADGEQALAFLHRTGVYRHAVRPELVLLDLNMPKIDGWGVLSAMQLDESLCAIPVIILSSSSRKSDEERAFSLGARGYLVKPLFYEAWVEQLKSAFAIFCPDVGPGDRDCLTAAASIRRKLRSQPSFRRE